MEIKVVSVTKQFGAFTALSDIDLQIANGCFCALLGPSGSGKTTLLRIIGGLDFPDRGEIHFDGSNVVRVDARHRRVGFVFQHYALFKHMSVFENVAFGLRVRPRRARPSRAEIRRRVNELLALVQMDSMAARFPAQLSGGQRQRVALARALAIEPRVLLLDEPFGALDARVRKDLRRWLRDLHDRVGLTSVFVTHDQEEALELADEVVVMNHSRIEQIGSPEQVYDNPASPFVFKFLGGANVLPGVARNGGVEVDNGVHLDAADIGLGGRAIRHPEPEVKSAWELLTHPRSFLTAWRERRASAGRPVAVSQPSQLTPDSSIELYVRPHDLDILNGAAASRPGLPATVSRVVTLGTSTRVEMRTDGSDHPLEALLSRGNADALALRPGAKVTVSPRKSAVFADSAASYEGQERRKNTPTRRTADTARGRQDAT